MRWAPAGLRLGLLQAARWLKREEAGERRATHPRLIDGVVEFGLHGDLAVGVGVHEGQAEAGVVATPGEETRDGRQLSRSGRPIAMRDESSQLTT